MIYIDHVSDYIKYIESNTDKYGVDRLFLYRGESSLDYKLIPSIYRTRTVKYVTAPVYLTKSTESRIIRQFIRKAASYISLNPDANDLFPWLVYAQHFGVPTRLLDWTENPLVALYFAAASNAEKDGRVYFLNSSAYVDLMIPFTEPLNFDELKKTVKHMIEDNTTDGFPYPVAFCPNYIDKRMMSQSSYFMIWGSKQDTLDTMITELETKNEVKQQVNSIDRNGVVYTTFEKCSVLLQIIIPSKNKPRVLRELDRMGINQATLFPGLDGIGKSIEWKNNYFNREDDNL